MKKTPRFLLCNNPMVDHQNLFILCTRKPKALYEIIQDDSGKFDIQLQELYSGTDRDVEIVLHRILHWYLAYLSGNKTSIEEED